MKLEGTFMKVGVRNNNGRIYTAEAIEEAFAAYQKKVDDGKAFGTILDIDHPSESFEPELKDISHRVTEVNYNEDTGEVFGKIELYEDTPKGKIVKSIIDNFGSLDIAPSMIVDNSNTVNGAIGHVERLNSFDICKESAWPEAKVKPTTTQQ